MIIRRAHNYTLDIISPYCRSENIIERFPSKLINFWNGELFFDKYEKEMIEEEFMDCIENLEGEEIFMQEKMKIDPQNDKVVSDKDSMSTEELNRFEKSVESESDTYNDMEDLNNVIGK